MDRGRPSAMGRWDKDGNWAVGSCIAIFFAIGFWMWWSYHWDFGDICPANEQTELALCARSWIGALAGYFATVFGALTILMLLKQINQSERHREAALQREGRLVADMLLIDLLVTAERLRELARKIDLDPPIAEISRKMIPDAVKVTPVLAIALQKHCLEVSDFVNRALQNFQLAGQLLSTMGARTGRSPEAGNPKAAKALEGCWLGRRRSFWNFWVASPNCVRLSKKFGYQNRSFGKD
ncbi:hypothetical protein LB543_22250 [Mesorhizobium sp. ESP7-2]|uniref:hypothetical protein n=1 Tax=unclassified Mesorhizobium TaxID=325217 RepID=UPI001CC97743|nr:MULTISPECIES: hypothetical protein [unclassified Mesorhizobium]MBZ9673107.1 hypothetical protein [Mesorhizobium sp. ES1-3]MBZ9709446.1 hypothetical protein [Mesorhizobium sp. ESP7-2]